MKRFKSLNLLTIMIIYLLVTIILSNYNYSLLFDVINPIFYSLLLIYILTKRRYNHYHNEKYYFVNALIMSFILILIFLYSGFIIGFYHNIYSYKPLAILKNILWYVLPIVSIEFTRSYIINQNKKNRWHMVLITIILLLLEVNYGVYLLNFNNHEYIFEYTASTLVPLIAESVLSSYLVYIGNYKISLPYRITKVILTIFVPIVPRFDWFMLGIIGIVYPVIIYFLFKFFFVRRIAGEKRKGDNKISMISLTITIIIVFFLSAFMLGLFKYDIVGILSNSMDPIYNRGDAVIYENLSETDLKKIPINSIIVFRVDNQIVAHRIISVNNDRGKISYQTKGDANNAPDVLYVYPDQILGVYKFKIKYIAYPSVKLNEYFNHDSAKVETK